MVGDPTIDVGTGGTGARAPQDFAINKEVPFSFLENAPIFLRKMCPRSVVPPGLRCFLRPWTRHQIEIFHRIPSRNSTSARQFTKRNWLQRAAIDIFRFKAKL